MRLEKVRKYEVLARIKDFGVAHAILFAAGSVAAQLLAIIITAVDGAQSFVVAHISGGSAAQERMSAKRKAKKALYAAMLGVSRTARAIAAEVAGLEDKFRMPTRNVDQTLIQTARSFVENATPYATRFVAHGLPDTFLGDLTAKADAFERVILDRAAVRESRASASVGTVNTINEGFAAARRLDTILKNQLANDPETLAAWKAARRMSRLGTVNPHEKPAPEPPVKSAA